MKDKKKKKGLFKRIFEKLDSKLEKKAKEKKCCSSDGNKCCSK